MVTNGNTILLNIESTLCTREKKCYKDLRIRKVEEEMLQRSQDTRGGRGNVTKFSGYGRWNCLTTTANRDQLLSWQSAVHFNGFSASGQLEATELIRNMITNLQRRQPDQTQLKFLQMSGDVYTNLGPAIKYPYVLATSHVEE